MGENFDVNEVRPHVLQQEEIWCEIDGTMRRVSIHARGDGWQADLVDGDSHAIGATKREAVDHLREFVTGLERALKGKAPPVKVAREPDPARDPAVVAELDGEETTSDPEWEARVRKAVSNLEASSRDLGAALAKWRGVTVPNLIRVAEAEVELMEREHSEAIAEEWNTDSGSAMQLSAIAGARRIVSLLKRAWGASS